MALGLILLVGRDFLVLYLENSVSGQRKIGSGGGFVGVAAVQLAARVEKMGISPVCSSRGKKKDGIKLMPMSLSSNAEK